MPGMLLSCGEGARVIRGDVNAHRGRVGRCSMAGSLPVAVDARSWVCEMVRPNLSYGLLREVGSEV